MWDDNRSLEDFCETDFKQKDANSLPLDPSEKRLKPVELKQIWAWGCVFSMCTNPFPVIRAPFSFLSFCSSLSLICCWQWFCASSDRGRHCHGNPHWGYSLSRRDPNAVTSSLLCLHTHARTNTNTHTHGWMRQIKRLLCSFTVI